MSLLELDDKVYKIPNKVMKAFDDMSDYINYLEKENERLKYHLNDIVFDDNNTDVELGARLLVKLGYCNFDEGRKVYINTHNNQPLMQKDEKEKSYYLKDDELDDYTKQLEYKINKAIEYMQNYIEVEDAPINQRIKIEFKEVLKLLKGEENE